MTDPSRAGHASEMGTPTLSLPLDSRDEGSGEASAPRAHPSFDDVYEQTFDFAWRSARRLGVPESAVDDVVQDAFLVVHRRLAEFEGRSSLRTWVFAILMRVVSDHRRTTRRKGGHAELPDADVLRGHGAEPGAALEQREASALLHGLLDTLDDEKRAVFVLAELEEMGAPEIASALGIPVNTVYSRLRAAREAFDRALVRHRARERGDVERARAKERR